MNRVNVRDYGAKPGMDCAQIFQKAEDDMAALGGGIIQVPKGVYDVSEAFYHRSFNTLTGKGDLSIIRNSSTNPGPDQFCIYIGNFAPTTFSECMHFDTADIKAGDTTVKLTLKDWAIMFLVGQAVLIDSKAGFMSDDGHWKPYAAFINRVKAVDKLTGTITLEDAVSIDITAARIASTTDFAPNTKNDKSYICQYPIIQNVRFESLGDWTMRFGCYKGWFENISLKTTDMIAGNGFSHCTFRNIKGEFSQKPVETAMYSHNTIIDGLIAKWWAGAVDPNMKPLVKMGENVRDCLYNNLDIDAGQGKNFGMAIRFEHAFNNKITNSKFNCPTIAQNGIELTTSDANAFVQGNEVLGNTFVFGGSDSYMKLDDKSGKANMKNNKITGNTFSGAVRKSQVYKNADATNIIDPNTFK